MPGVSGTETVIALGGKILIAPVGTAAPADHVAAWGAGWIDLGYTDEDGVKPRESKDMGAVPAWQTPYAVRRWIKSRSLRIGVTLLQWNKDVIKVAFGGGTFAAAGTGQKYTPPTDDAVDERALGIEWVDGTDVYRQIVPKVVAIEDVEWTLSRGDNAKLPLTFEVIATAGVAPWYFLSNDASWV